MNRTNDTRIRLLEAAEHVIRTAGSRDDVSVRRIVAEAGTNVSSVSYHFGSLEKLGAECAARVYRRLNAKRLAELQQVADAAAPGPPRLDGILRALVGTSIRWSLDPTSPYAVFHYLSHLSSLSNHPEMFDVMVRDVEHHEIFVHQLCRAAPWFTPVEIRWRLAAALGVRTQFTRQTERCSILTGERVGDDPEHMIDELCAIMVPTFEPPSRPRPVVSPRQKRATNSV